MKKVKDSLRQQFKESRKYLLERDITPYMVIFSTEGLWQARREARDEGRDLFDMATTLIPSTYCGLPYGVDPEQSVPIKVTGPASSYAVSPLSDDRLAEIICYQMNIRKRDNRAVSPLLRELHKVVEHEYGELSNDRED